MRQHPTRGSRPAALLVSTVGVMILVAVAVYSVPLTLAVLRDPTSHEAGDAGMAAIFVLIPLSAVGIACLLLGYVFWRTRAGGVALATATSVVVLATLNLGGIPTLIPAIGVALAGTAVAIWFLYRDLPD